ncbi:MAG TPA: divalent metal cation transporter [Rhodopila sp.]|uniref:NRAMP family divalent metal transporter n=1 Tax=Rhodopila sp. TaxID=2480087 RepID=UPI002BC59118|nr:divalent metal cation transporter [Rhodopila sp.]HVY15797.1 divalent metal cation transporter [Rhodopila sp.]
MFKLRRHFPSRHLLAKRIAVHRAPRQPPGRGLWSVLGPGLITGASDDDPSGIATYSQVGAAFGTGMCWVMLFTFPLMAAIQEISARIGRVTGHGIAGNIRTHYPRWVLLAMVALLLVANIINLGADLGAMGDALALIFPGARQAYVVAFAVGCAALETFSRYERYVTLLKWCSTFLLAYVATAFAVDTPWGQVAHNTFIPNFSFGQDYVVGIVAVLGTTITPYCFFWQSSQEAEDERIDPHAKPLLEAPEQAKAQIGRIRVDTYVGMGYSNLISLFIIVTAAATLHAHGITDIQTSAQAAEALRPIAGPLTFALFAAGIIGIGLLAIPVLAGSCAYALGEALDWPTGLSRLPLDARAFYGTITVATLIGMGINFVDVDPVKALFWSAVINGVVAVPLMATMMVMGSAPKVLGRFTLPWGLTALGWLCTGVMAVAVVIMIATW